MQPRGVQNCAARHIAAWVGLQMFWGMSAGRMCLELLELAQRLLRVQGLDKLHIDAARYLVVHSAASLVVVNI